MSGTLDDPSAISGGWEEKVNHGRSRKEMDARKFGRRRAEAGGVKMKYSGKRRRPTGLDISTPL